MSQRFFLWTKLEHDKEEGAGVTLCLWGAKGILCYDLRMSIWEMEFDILPGCLVSVGINICKMYRWTFRTFFALKEQFTQKRKIKAMLM